MTVCRTNPVQAAHLGIHEEGVSCWAPAQNSIFPSQRWSHSLQIALPVMDRNHSRRTGHAAIMAAMAETESKRRSDPEPARRFLAFLLISITKPVLGKTFGQRGLSPSAEERSTRVMIALDKSGPHVVGTEPFEHFIPAPSPLTVTRLPRCFERQWSGFHRGVP